MNIYIFLPHFLKHMGLLQKKILQAFFKKILQGFFNKNKILFLSFFNKCYSNRIHIFYSNFEIRILTRRIRIIRILNEFESTNLTKVSNSLSTSTGLRLPLEFIPNTISCVFFKRHQISYVCLGMGNVDLI